MTEDNLTRQVDEVEALSAIYPDEWRVEDESHRTYQASVTLGRHNLTLLITLPPEYPCQSPPLYLLTAPWMGARQRDELCTQLEQIYLDNAGESILHLWIDKLKEYLESNTLIEDEPSTTETVEPAVGETRTKFALPADTVHGACPDIISSAPFCDRKSTFQGHAARVTSLNQVKLVLNKLYENRKIAQATHNIYAYRIYNGDTKSWLQDCEDDGEAQAGGRLMHLMQILDVRDVLVVVSRWFGGILLGGDRFKHINNAARDVLELGGFLTPNKSNNNSIADDAKKKTKKGK